MSRWDVCEMLVAAHSSIFRLNFFIYLAMI